jgi:signal transduction histidine kinase
MYLVPLAWGMAVRARRQLAADQRRAERARIAQEMHDVLGHRISLASVHAGALAYRMAQADGGHGQPLDPAEVRRAVAVINDTVRMAMVELSEVLAVLRDEDSAVTGRPSPGLSDLQTLVTEAAAAGQRVTLDVQVPASVAPRLRPSVQRTVYRVVQEGLTNARKHAPTAEVAVTVRAAPDDGLRIIVTNPIVAPSSAVAPGARSGLIGLSERVALDGGTLQHGVTDGAFRLEARLPWPS